MSYKDSTFCKAKDCIKFNTCHRALTDDVKASAEMWWGNGEALISTFIEPEKLDCYEASIQEQAETE